MGAKSLLRREGGYPGLSLLERSTVGIRIKNRIQNKESSSLVEKNGMA
jgi:hypothetical protein